MRALTDLVSSTLRDHPHDSAIELPPFATIKRRADRVRRSRRRMRTAAALVAVSTVGAIAVVVSGEQGSEIEAAGPAVLVAEALGTLAPSDTADLVLTNTVVEGSAPVDVDDHRLALLASPDGEVLVSAGVAVAPWTAAPSATPVTIGGTVGRVTWHDNGGLTLEWPLGTDRVAHLSSVGLTLDESLVVAATLTMDSVGGHGLPYDLQAVGPDGHASGDAVAPLRPDRRGASAAFYFCILR